jgi:DNA-binding IclR family transcriptional regulator
MVPFRTLRKKIQHLPEVQGVSALDILELPDEIGALIRKMSNEKTMTLPEVAEHLGFPRKRTKSVMTLLVRKGYMTTQESDSPEGPMRYRVAYARMRKKNIPLDL